MKNSELMREIVQSYDENDAEFGEKAMRRVLAHFADMPKSKSKTDPTRMGTRSTFVSRLKMALLDKAGSIELGLPESKEFDQMKPQEQLKHQKAARRDGTPKWLISAEIVPKNIQAVRLPDDDMLALRKHRVEIDTDKLRVDMAEVDGDKMINTLVGMLEKPNAKWSELACGLLLATGRRTIEVLQTGDFYLEKDMSSDQAAAVFSGQAKNGVSDPYVIPLLCSFSLMKSAFDRLRAAIDTKGMSTAQVNSTYRGPIATVLSRIEPEVTPHELRGIYAIATYELMEGKKMSLIGYISRVLGHTTAANAAYYQRIKVNLSGPYKPQAATAAADLQGWVANSKPEAKRIQAIQELMAKRTFITASAIRGVAGGTMAVNQRVIDNNAGRIQAYHATLEI